MLEHQGIEKGAKIAKKNIFDFLSFWSGLINNYIFSNDQKKITGFNRDACRKEIF